MSGNNIIERVLIIGSQGYLGSRLTPYLIEKGFDVSCYDTGFFKDGIISPVTKHKTLKKDARLLNLDDFKGFDAVILLAGISNDPFGKLSSAQIYDPTLTYALKIAKFCKSLKIKFIFPSSCSVYGATSASGLLSETSKTNPQTPYSLNKVQIEDGLKDLANETFSPIALRFGTVYGMSPRIRFDVVINMLCGLALTSKKITLNSDGQAWRPHLHIDDACEALACCLDNEIKTDGLLVLNVGRNEDNYKILEIAKIVKSNVAGAELSFLGSGSDKKEVELIKDRKIQDGVDTRTYKVSFDRIKSKLPKFRCKWNVEAGIKDLIDQLIKVPLNKEIFGQRQFYRLQQIEYLHSSGKIDNDLYWVKK